ncbi:MAG TPA: tripartite tricarboxylate transporter permease [Thermodesulfobacteriota bacterium]|nr:tripartite tricarboxylate transporter permease [Thermodesulfobacteriota bacterium]
MDSIHGLLYGLSRAVEPQILILAFLGCFWGTMVGVLPGIGPVAGITILMPFTFGIDLTSAMVMMAGIYYGAMYGGSTTSILVAVPGETSSIVTIFDGHQMAKQGRAGAALALSAIGSFVAGTVGILGLTFLAPPLAELAIGFGPPEYFALALVGLSMSSFLSNASLAKGLAMAVVGLITGTVGLDIISGAPRFTFNSMELAGGLEIVSILIGLYGISEVMEMMASKVRPQIQHEKLWNLHRLLPNREEWRLSIWPIIRGSFMGFFVGALPGAGGTVPSFISYAMEKRISKNPERFGKGAPEGVAGPESANNSGAVGAMVVLLTLGLPYNVVTAVMLSAMIAHGIFPSPLLMARSPDFFWTVVASMYIGNFMLLILNLPLIGAWASLLRLPYRWMTVFIVLFCIIGVYSIEYRSFDLLLMALFGGIGYLMKRVDLPAAPLALAMVLGPIMEKSLIQSLIMSDGSPFIFVTRPFAAGSMALFFLLMFLPLIQKKLGRRIAPVGEVEV